MSPAPALGSALAQRQLAPAAMPTAEAPMTDVSHETPPTHDPAWSALAALHIDAQRQLGAMQQRLIAAQLGVKQETLSRAFAKLREVGVRTETREIFVESVSRLASQCETPGRASRAAARLVPVVPHVRDAAPRTDTPR